MHKDTAVKSYFEQVYNLETKNQESTFDKNKIEQGVKLILEGIGENLNRDGIQDTPNRVAKMYQELCANTNKSLKDLKLTTFQDESCGQLILVKDIFFSTICEHHLLPFFGKAHVAYIPNSNKIIGLSKIARLVDFYSKKLQVQERLTREIANALYSTLGAKGVIVYMSAEHMCMSIRGAQKPGATTTTSSELGVFSTDINLKTQFLNLI